MSDEDAEAYLVSLPGVGIKTAKCVLMYSLRRAVLPVDTHVARVSRRLGLLAVKFQDVVSIEIESGDGYSATDTLVRAMPVVMV